MCLAYTLISAKPYFGFGYAHSRTLSIRLEKSPWINVESSKQNTRGNFLIFNANPMSAFMYLVKYITNVVSTQPRVSNPALRIAILDFESIIDPKQEKVP